ncbi:unnamed protein product [Rotaria sp. Silwood2]|nr:unnamed protein product [Rotaria sp. Silwood2]CAF4498909.1 unnamed protein product [Rotaria sp. Silwood2]
MSTNINSSKSCICCGKNFKKREHIHPLDISKEWFKFVFKQELLQFFIDQACFMPIYHAYQASLVDNKLEKVSEKINIAVQTDAVNSFVFSAALSKTITTAQCGTSSSVKRRGLDSM